MSTLGEAYIAEMMAENQMAAARAARVKQFIADSNPELIADLFAMIRAALIEREADEMFAITKYYRSAAMILTDVETEFCR